VSNFPGEEWKNELDLVFFLIKELQFQERIQIKIFFSCKKIHHAGTQRKKDCNWNMYPFHSPNNKRKQRPRIAQIYETIPPQLKGK